MKHPGSRLNGFIKLFALVLIAALLALAAYFFWDVSRQPPPHVPEPFAAPVSSTPVKKRFAPEGVLYLKERTTITTASGITGVPVGSEVKVIERKGEKITVEYHGNQLTVPARQLTDDLDLVESSTKAKSPPTPPQTKISEASQPASTSSPDNGGTSFSSQVSSCWQGLCSWVASFFITPPPPLPPPPIDSKKVKNRHETIRFYEREIRYLEEHVEQLSTVNKTTPNTIYNSSKNQVNRSSSPANSARLEQIAEYKSRIAKMKAEIGES